MLEPVLSGRIFDGAEAGRLGLVNRVVLAADLLDAAPAFASELTTKPPLMLAAALSALHRGMNASSDDGLSIEEAAFAGVVPTHDAQESMAQESMAQESMAQESMAQEGMAQEGMAQEGVAQEGVAAFLEKHLPAFLSW